MPSEMSHAHDPVAAYTAISHFFKAHKDKVAEVEILPSAFTLPEGQIVLQDGVSLGVTKRTLAQAFIAARQLFFQHRGSEDATEKETALEATKPILLFDPEHLTACNHRKRHLLSLPPHSLPLHLTRELCFLDTILTSPLHRQTKSPTLWSHRRWLVEAYLPQLITLQGASFPGGGQDGDSERRRQEADDGLGGFVKRELDVVFKAGERHPKNYYAFRYARDLLGIITHPSRVHPRGKDMNGLLGRCIGMTKDWCLKHPSDVSGWSFLLWLLRRWDHVRQEEVRTEHKEGKAAVVENVVRLAVGFGWANESLWWFVGEAVSDPNVLSDDDSGGRMVAVMLKAGIQALKGARLGHGEQDDDGKSARLEERMSKVLRKVEESLKSTSAQEEVL